VPLTLTIPVSDRALLTPYVQRAYELARDVADVVGVAPRGRGVSIVGTVGDVSRATMLPFLELSTRLNEELLRARDSTPSVYGSGVRYEIEPPGREDWDPADVLLRRGWGDCEDLAAWRAAELRDVGERARADTYVSRERPDGSRVWHAVVVRSDGSVEDPSAHLGMRIRPGHHPDGTPFGDVLADMMGVSVRRARRTDRQYAPARRSGAAPWR
jgi:hypothetical protein